MDKKILVVLAEAEAVRTIFARYLELGSVRALAEDLDRRGIRSKPRRLSNGRCPYRKPRTADRDRESVDTRSQ